MTSQKHSAAVRRALLFCVLIFSAVLSSCAFIDSTSGSENIVTEQGEAAATTAKPVTGTAQYALSTLKTAATTTTAATKATTKKKTTKATTKSENDDVIRVKSVNGTYVVDLPTSEQELVDLEVEYEDGVFNNKGYITAYDAFAVCGYKHPSKNSERLAVIPLNSNAGCIARSTGNSGWLLIKYNGKVMWIRSSEGDVIKDVTTYPGMDRIQRPRGYFIYNETNVASYGKVTCKHVDIWDTPFDGRVVIASLAYGDSIRTFGYYDDTPWCFVKVNVNGNDICGWAYRGSDNENFSM